MNRNALAHLVNGMEFGVMVGAGSSCMVIRYAEAPYPAAKIGAREEFTRRRSKDGFDLPSDTIRIECMSTHLIMLRAVVLMQLDTHTNI